MALAQWVRPLAYCENDRFAQAVLLSQMHDRRIASAPIWDDVTTLVPELLPRQEIDIIYGGFPCQDISVAGNGKGLGGERSGLFFEIVRLCRELRPRFVFLENVPAITLRGLDTVCAEFTALRYDCRWTIVSAAEMGAPHLRERWFFLAHANSDGIRLEPDRKPERAVESDALNYGEKKYVPNTSSKRCGETRGFRRDESTERIASGGEENVANSSCIGRREGDKKPRGLREGTASTKTRNGPTDSRCHGSSLADTSRAGSQGWLDTQSAWTSLRFGSGSGSEAWPCGIPEPAIRRGADGLSNRAHRIKCLGNAVVPSQAREAFMRLMGIV